MDVFDRILLGEIPSHKIYEDDYCISFLDIAPIRKGHVLVVPRRCVPTIGELSEQEAAELFLAVRRISIKMRKALGCDGINVFINDGRAAGQEIAHAHVHLLPRFFADGGFDITRKEKYEDGEAERFCELLSLL